VVDEVALEKVFLRVLTFSLVSRPIILPVLRIPLDLNIQNHFFRRSKGRSLGTLQKKVMLSGK